MVIVVVVVLRMLPALDYLKIPHPMILYELRLLGSKNSSLFCLLFLVIFARSFGLFVLVLSVLFVLSLKVLHPFLSGAVPNSSTTLVLLLPVSPPICRCQ